MRRPPARPEISPSHATAAARIADQRSLDRLPLLYRMLLHSPSVATGWNELGSSIRYATTLGDRLRELIICFVARSTGSNYEWEAHAPIARSSGLTDDVLDALPDWSAAPGLSDSEQAALALAEQVLTGIVDDVRFDAAAEHFNDEELLEVVAATAYYLAVSRFLQAFGIEAEDADN